ncbi:zinc finger protein 76-like [Anopheles albimanus]|uniref:zinc finger protein 76-like n=1 Tax=Anopheles albimanus TaxID=7167 RepID=UPI0016406D92|nr:zinc finger protein 76-like [Anopheles albimanus]
MDSKVLWEVCMLCSKRDSSMGIIVCAADDVKLSEQIFKVTQYRVPELPAILSPVCDGCRSQIVQCDQVPPISVTATDNKYPTVLLNVEPNDPLAVPESVQKLYRRNYVPAEEWRKHLAGNLMKIFQHMCKLCGTVVRSMEKHSAEHQIGDMYRCFFCHLSFVSKPLLNCHISGHKKKLFVCHFCGQAYRTMALLKSHMIRCCYMIQGRRRSKVYSCACCGKRFSSNYQRLKHQDQHDKKRLYECFVCREMFPSLEYLQSHRRNHAVDRTTVQLVETSSDAPDPIDSNAMEGGDFKNTDFQNNATTEREQQDIPASEPLLTTEPTGDNVCMEKKPSRKEPLLMLGSDTIAPTNDALVVTEPTSGKSVSMEEKSSRKETLTMLGSDSIAPTNDALAVTAPTSDKSVSMEENQSTEKPLDIRGSDSIAFTSDLKEKESKECINKSSTIDITEHSIPMTSELPKTSQANKRITVLEVIDLPRLVKEHKNEPLKTGPIESPITSKEAVTPSPPEPDDPSTTTACEESTHRPKLLKLEICPAWKSYEKINPELWPILGVPTSIPLALTRKDIGSSMEKHKEKRRTKQRFEDRLLQLSPCVKKDCNCDDFMRCLYTQ